MILNPKRCISCFGDITPEIADKISQRAIEFVFQDNEAEIYLLIGSGGGSTIAGFALCDLFASVLKPKLTTIALGEIGSMAVAIFLSGAKRFIAKNAYVYLHEASRVFKNTTTVEIRNLKGAIEDLAYSHKTYVKILVERSGGKLTQAHAEELMHKETTLSPEQAIELGIAHEILG